jgi:methylthioribose-1-phosphate isomerase
LSIEDRKTIRFIDKGKKSLVVLINQRKLPNKIEYVKCYKPERLAKSIKSMEIRGAPAIGVAAAMALALAASRSDAEKKENFHQDIMRTASLIRSTRPTANNLFWAVERIISKTRETLGSVEEIRNVIVNEAIIMAEEDIEVNRTMGEYGADLLEDGDTVGTICNAGWLATAGVYGTALGVIKIAHEQGKKISVIAMETRPLLQGARLSAFELKQDNINLRVITDSMIGYCLYKGMIDKFICGADRIVTSGGGHVLNKIGTYTAALAADKHQVPFYVASPISTFDFQNKLENVIVEERNPLEIKEIGGYRITPTKVQVFNPAFDITPPELIKGIITEKGIIHPPIKDDIARTLQIK